VANSVKVTSPRGRRKVGKVMREYKAGKLHSGSKRGPKVTSRRQAIAIGLSEGRKAQRGKY
jgi:hypothetical protein